MDTEGIGQVAEKLKSSTRVVVLTGAGISQESGVPTFRGADGLWQNFRAEDLATPEAFEKDPEFYAFVRTLKAYEKSLKRDTTIVLPSDSELFQYLSPPMK